MIFGFEDSVKIMFLWFCGSSKGTLDSVLDDPIYLLTGIVILF